MDTRDAYDAICRALERDEAKRLVSAEFNELVFGNFVVSFERAGCPSSVVNDRGQLFLCDNLNGLGQCAMVVDSIREAGEQDLLRQIGVAGAE
jgi:hypothetical protein